MKFSYDELYNKAQDAIARPVHVANPNPLYNKTTITKNGYHDVSSFATSNIDVKDDGGGDVVFKKVKITNSRTSGTATQNRIKILQPIVNGNEIKEQTVTILSGASADVNVIPATVINFMYVVTLSSSNDTTVTGSGAKKVVNLINNSTRYTVISLSSNVSEFTVGE